MLNFSKIKIISIYLLFIIISFFTFLNFQKDDKNILNKKVNLGLDLQGGSYLLLEIDTNPLIEERIQSKVLPLKKLLKKNNINYNNFFVKKDNIIFEIEDNNIKKFEKLFFAKKDNLFNSFIQKYNGFELNLETENNIINIFFSKVGVINLNNSALNLSIEIV